MSTKKINIDVVKISNGRYVLISENRINFISEIIDGDIKDIIKEEKGVIIQAQQNKIVSKSKERINISSLGFIPTLDCNLRCIYCYSRGGEQKVYMDKKTAKSAIDAVIMFRKNHKPNKILIYFVGGGEPFLNFECMKYICAYAKDNFAETEITLVSNGTFGKKEFQWLVQNNATIRISYDGLCHSFQRPFASGQSSQKIVQENIRNLVSAQIPLTVQLTITGESVKLMGASVTHIADLGVKYIKIEPVHHSMICRGEEELVPDHNTFVDNFINTINLILESNLKVKIDNSFISRPTSGYYCGTGEGTNRTITPFGDITGCLEIVKRGEKYADIMLYGTCVKGKLEIDKLKRKFLNKLHYSNYQQCRMCNLKLICGGGCPMQGGWDNNDLLNPSAYSCSIHKSLIPKLFEMVFIDNKILEILFDNHEILKSC